VESISVNKEYQYISRIDHTFGPKDALSGYWFIENDGDVDDQSFDGGSLPGFANNRPSAPKHESGLEHTFGTNMINEVRIGYNRLGFNTIIL